MHKAGVSAVFSAHSTRSAANSADLVKGIDISVILKRAGWSSSSTFHGFYNKPLQN